MGSKTVTTTIRIEPELLKKAKHIAVDQSIPLSELLGRALRKYIEEFEKSSGHA